MSYRNWAVLITEHQQKTVYVEAQNALEAIAKAKQNWVQGEYLMDEEPLAGVEISAVEKDTIVMLTTDRNGHEHMTGRRLRESDKKHYRT